MEEMHYFGRFHIVDVIWLNKVHQTQWSIFMEAELCNCFLTNKGCGSFWSRGFKHIDAPLMLEMVLMRFHMIHDMQQIFTTEGCHVADYYIYEMDNNKGDGTTWGFLNTRVALLDTAKMIWSHMRCGREMQSLD
jgi:hypothetical protein